MSDAEYGDFTLEFEIKLGELGNSGLALRAPMRGDPAFDGMEMQVADYRYNTSAKDSELTGGIYRAVAPTKQVYKPTEWNTFHVELKGDHLKATINGELIQDIDLSQAGPGGQAARRIECPAGEGPAEAGAHRFPVPQPRWRPGADPRGPDQDGMKVGDGPTRLEMLLEAGDDLVGDRDRHEMPSRNKVGLAAREGLRHLPGHGGGDDDIIEAVPERHMTVGRQIGEREAVMAIEPQLLGKRLGAISFDEDLAEIAQEQVEDLRALEEHPVGLGPGRNQAVEEAARDRRGTVPPSDGIPAWPGGDSGSRSRAPRGACGPCPQGRGATGLGPCR